MAKNSTWSLAARNAAIDAKAALLTNGYLRLYSGSQRTSPDTAITSQTLLSELRFTTFGSAVAGVATANAITPDSDANATGTVSWYACVASDGTTGVHDGSVGTSGANGIGATTSIVQHGVVQVPTFALTDAATSTQ